MFSFVMTVIWGTPLLRVLRHFRIGKLIRVDEPGHHNVKMGTPTMGGVLFILPVLLLTGLLNAATLIGFNAIGRSVLVPLIVLVGYAFLGALDDWEGIRGKRRGEGMRARTKFIAQVVLALGTAYVLKYFLEVPEIVCPALKARSSWAMVHPHCGVYHRERIECDQFHRWSRWACRFDLCNGVCRVWRHRPYAGTDLSCAFLFHQLLAHCSVFYGSTFIPPNCSWAIQARFHWAPPWQLLR